MRHSRSFLVLLAFFALFEIVDRVQAKSVLQDISTLVPPGSTWEYLDNGSDQGTAWTSTAFDDSAWVSGLAPLGYSDPVSTTVSFGPNSSNKYITTYFRHKFTVGSPTSYTTLTLSLRRDDGAVAYLNGVEVFRTNMPAGVITYTTLAATGVGEDYSFYTANFAASGLVAGNNVLAVEIHQVAVTSSDIGFDAQLSAYTPPINLPPPPLGVTRFAVIGDYGYDGQPEADVAALVKTWTPDFVVTTGDNNYDTGSAATIDANIGKHYHEFIAPYTGGYGAGSASGNRFWPATGNHDYYSTPPLQPYLDYFTLPGNERYYDVRKGAAHFFFLDTEDMVTNGAITTTQAVWLQNALALSSARWKIVVLHHPPYSSGSHGNTPLMQWPFETWGATAIFAGHDHIYERFQIGGIPYFVDGLGGQKSLSFECSGGGQPGALQRRLRGDAG
ncbi:MAG TPA: metallophosphoesterase [Thermoflexales bacterium]|nr:metallophosphoesterase [Thermoflexales bacterium]